MKKRGSHVGIMLSFAIFITFLAFIYSILQPAIKIHDNKQFILDALAREIIKEISGNLTTITISNNSSTSYDCLKINTNELGINGINSIVKKEDSQIADYNYTGSDILIEYNNEKIFKIYSSDFIESQNTSISCENISEDYKVGLLKIEDYAFIKKIEDLINKTKEEYSTVKSELKISPVNDFSFSFDYNNGIIHNIEIKNVSTNVFSEEYSIIYVNNEGDISRGVLKVMIW